MKDRGEFQMRIMYGGELGVNWSRIGVELQDGGELEANWRRIGGAFFSICEFVVYDV